MRKLQYRIERIKIRLIKRNLYFIVALLSNFKILISSICIYYRFYDLHEKSHFPEGLLNILAFIFLLFTFFILVLDIFLYRFQHRNMMPLYINK